MKFLMLIKSSIKSNVLITVFFNLFVIISAVLILVSVSIIMPLQHNIRENIINHISNREIHCDYEKRVTQDAIDYFTEEIRKVEHVADCYGLPLPLTVSDDSGKLPVSLSLEGIHKTAKPKIVKGRLFKESEKNVVVVPAKLKYVDENNKIVEFDGTKLVGEKLTLRDEEEYTHKVKVVGAFVAQDPIFDEESILIPRAQLEKFNEYIQSHSTVPKPKHDAKEYIILVDNYSNAEYVTDKVCDNIMWVYPPNSMTDAQTYTAALVILLAMLALFLVMVVVGFYLFLKNNINVRTSELALYRSIGYSTKNIFAILFYEHIISLLVSLIIGTIVSQILCNLVIDPYAFGLVGNTLMEMKIEVIPLAVVIIAALFVLILLMICRNAAKKSEKIDLTILLREN